jgi:hypothetical protein
MEFLCSCIKLIKEEIAVQELQNLIKQYDLGKIDPLLNKAVDQLSKKRRTNKELHLNAQIIQYDIDYVVLDLGSKVNVIAVIAQFVARSSGYEVEGQIGVT